MLLTDPLLAPTIVPADENAIDRVTPLEHKQPEPMARAVNLLKIFGELCAANRDGDIFGFAYQRRLLVTAKASDEVPVSPPISQENILERSMRLENRWIRM